MNSRQNRLEFFMLYNLYLRKNEEFRQAVKERRDKSELENIRASLEDLYRELAEKRGAAGGDRISNTE